MPKINVIVLWLKNLCLLQVRAVGREEQGWTALPKFPRNAGEPWAQAWPGPRHVIFGHHARRRLQVQPSCHPWVAIQQVLSLQISALGARKLPNTHLWLLGVANTA